MTRPTPTITGGTTDAPRRASPAGAVGLLVVSLVALAACADGAAPAPMPDEGEPPPPTPVTIAAVPGERARVVGWRLLRAAGRTVSVEVEYGGPPCDAVTGVDVEETTEQVRLTVWAGPVTDADDADCAGVPAMLGTAELTVPLAEPLGDRGLRPGR